MEIKLNSNFSFVGSDSHILGYIGETNARTINFTGLTVDGADLYKMQIDYPDNVSYEVDITSGSYIVDGSLLRMPCKIKCQILACKANGDSYTLVKKSNTFTLDIKQSLSEGAIPTYEQSVEALDKILSYESTAEKWAEKAEQAAQEAQAATEEVTDTANTATTQINDTLAQSEETIKGYVQETEKNAESASKSAKSVQGVLDEASKSAEKAEAAKDTVLEAAERAEKAASIAEHLPFAEEVEW
jgi:hypothetical protein